MALSKFARDVSWEYADNLETNLNSLNKIIVRIKSRAIPIIDLFKSEPSVLKKFTVSDLEEFHENYLKKIGVTVATTETRFAWAMTMIFENKNPFIAKQFAKYGLSGDDGDSDWFGDEDFRRVLADKKNEV